MALTQEKINELEEFLMEHLETIRWAIEELKKYGEQGGEIFKERS